MPYFLKAKSNEKNYKKDLIFLAVIMLLFIALVLTGIFMDLFKNNSFRVIIGITFAVCLLFSYLTSVRMMCISDNIFKDKYLSGNYKFKYPSKKYSFDYIKLWLENEDVSDTLYVKSATNKYYIIELAFDYAHRKFTNKTYVINDMEIKDLYKFISTLKTYKIIDDDNMVEIVSLFDNNDPKYFERAIDSYKK